MFLDQNSKVVSVEFSLCQIRYKLIRTFQNDMWRGFHFKLIEVETQAVFGVLKVCKSWVKILLLPGYVYW